MGLSPQSPLSQISGIPLAENREVSLTPLRCHVIDATPPVVSLPMKRRSVPTLLWVRSSRLVVFHVNDSSAATRTGDPESDGTETRTVARRRGSVDVYAY